MDNVSEVNLCKICSDKEAIYVCPRCNLSYCSVNCYKAASHVNCSETFYKEWVEQEIRMQESDPEARKKMMEILKRVAQGQEPDGPDEDLDSDDDEEIPDISERLAGIDLEDSEAIWERLTAEERREFSELVKNGDITKLLPPWQPWWAERHLRPKVRFLDDNTPVDSYKNNCPQVPKIISPLSSLTNVKPSPTIRNNVANVLGGYVLIARYFNGAHSSFPAEAVSILLRVSRNLSSGQIYQNLDMALVSIHQEALAMESMKVNHHFAETIREDVQKILDGPNEDEKNFYLLCALSNINKLLVTAKKCKKLNNVEGTFSKSFLDHTNNGYFPLAKQQLAIAIKKIKYYLSWAAEYKLQSTEF